MNWIRTTDNYPAKRSRVLFYNEHIGMQLGVFLPVYVTQFSDFENVFLSDNGGHYVNVSHWAIPEPPQLI